MRQNGARATPIKSKSGLSKLRWRLSSMDVQSVELLSARRSRRLSGERSKQPREEVLAAPSPHLIRHSQRLPANDVVCLAAALYNPIWTTSVGGPGNFGSALIGLVTAEFLSATVQTRLDQLHVERPPKVRVRRFR
jgi:hypothetical protein